VDLPPEWFDDFRRDLDAYVAELHHANELEESA